MISLDILSLPVNTGLYGLEKNINILSMIVKAPSNTKVPFNFISTALKAT